MVDVAFALPLVIVILTGTRLRLLRALKASRRDMVLTVSVLAVAIYTLVVSI